MNASGPGGVLKKSTNAVAKKRRKAGGATVKKAVVGPTKKLAQGVVKESNLGKASGDHRQPSVDKLDESVDNASNTDEDYSDDGDEGTDGYKLGGYHQVNIGDKFNARYNVVEKLGWGHFSTVWMCWDKKAAEKGTSEFIALKIQKSAAHYREAALDEIELLSCASSAALSDQVMQEFGPSYDPCVVLLLNHFDHNGPNGRHVCMSFEMLGDNLLKVIKKYDYRGIPIPIVKNFVRQILVGLDFLHRHCSIIHTDLKPENILIGTPPPTPSIEKVKKIIVDSNGGNNLATKAAKIASSAGKKKKKKSTTTIDMTMTSAIEFIQKELDLGKSLTAEERKKLKKKIKKKKQQVRKNETKKQDEPPVVSKRRKSADNSAATEMMLMERDSFPLAMKEEIKERSLSIIVADISPTPKAVVIDDDEDSSDDKRDNRFPESLVDSMDDDDEMEERFRDFSLDREERPVECMNDAPLMPSWLRPTLFGYLNFEDDGRVSNAATVELGRPSQVAATPIGAGAAGLVPVWKADHIKPLMDDFARISLIAPYSRMVSTFGTSKDFDCTNDDSDGDSDLRYAQWFFTLPSTADNFLSSSSTGANGVGHQTTAAKKTSKEAKSSHISVIGCGEDTAGISSLMCICLLDVLTQQPHVYSLQRPVQHEDRPVVWHIEFSASETHDVVKCLEEMMTGVFFLAHHDVSNAVMEADDSDLLYVSRKLCIHSAIGLDFDDDNATRSGTPSGRGSPLSLTHSSPGRSLVDVFAKMRIKDDSEHKNVENISISENSSTSIRRNSSVPPRSGGSLIGIDLDALSQRVYVASLEMEDEDIPGRPFFTEASDLRRFVKPLEKRLAVFLMNDKAEVDALATGFMSAINDSGNDSHRVESKFLSNEEKEADEKKRKFNAKMLENEYLHAKVKVVDLGNACWTYKHFTDDIQTRQYRAPEVLLGASYETSVDIWSLACIVFELVTGDLLFDPQEGKCWDREEDHLAMMIELLGNFPKSVTTNGKFCGDYFNRKGDLKHIHSLKFWGLREVLHDKYKLAEDDANSLADFLNSLLEIDPNKRATAQEAQNHPWLCGSSNISITAEGGVGGGPNKICNEDISNYDEKSEEKNSVSSQSQSQFQCQSQSLFGVDCKGSDKRSPHYPIKENCARSQSESKHGRENGKEASHFNSNKQSFKGEY